MNLIDFQDDIILLAIFLLLGFITREIVKPLQKLYIPSSVIGGVIGLILGQQVLGIVQIPDSFGQISSVLINVIMAYVTMQSEIQVVGIGLAITIVSLILIKIFFWGKSTSKVKA